jgi:uncharacterized cofD-like protein
VSIKALLALGVQTSAVVAMADDGGSSGMLREHTGKVPPGDIRKCLIAMAASPDGAWARAFKQRFNYVNDHTLGNLMLTALTDATGSFPEAIRLCEELLDAQGRVYPSTLESVVLKGVTRDGRRLNGQATICASDTALESVSLTPAAPLAYQPALAALRAADLIVLGPGSLFTSIIPNLLVPGVLEAIAASRARTVFLCSLADMQGETWGLTSAELVEALLYHGMRGLLDYVVAHQDPTVARKPGTITAMFEAVGPDTVAPAVPPAPAQQGSIRRVAIDDELAQQIRAQGPQLLIRNLVDPIRPTWHDMNALSEVLEGVLRACPSPQK